MLDNIPRELRERQQWVTWRYEPVEGKKPTKVPHNPVTGARASSTDPAQWVTFEQAKAGLETGWYSGIGYVLAANDPYSFIDLDTYDPTLTDEDKERHKKIAGAFTGYAERSPSGQGLHLIVKGKVPAGRKRLGVEVYSAERYMTMTGDVYRAEPIQPHPELLNTLWEELAPPQDDAPFLMESKPEQIDDWTLCERAAGAINGAKFVSLYKGEWQTSYGSQSEADFALIDIIAFYTDNHEQVARIFRQSELGKRDKAKRNSYVLPMVKRSFDAKPPHIDMSALQANMAAMLARLAPPQEPEKVPAPAPSPVAESRAVEAPISVARAVSAGAAEPADEVYSLPPGLLGEIAQYVYDSAPRPVQEIALTAAIGLMAGITGRSYNINGTGLNHYLLLLAPTGSGKEAIAGGIGAIMGEVEKRVPHSGDFVGPGEIRSDAALLKYISKRSSSFVTVGGEFGQTLAMMAQQNASSQMRGIKKVMLDLYGKSGQGHFLRPTIYSDSDKNTSILQSPAFSFVGESAPESFFNSVDEALIADGMIPRFTLIEYTGKRPDLNENANFDPPLWLIERVASLCAQSLMLNNANTAVQVQIAPDARAYLDAFDRECTRKINDNGSREVIRHLWNRAHLRALKLAGLVAVGINPYKPVVTIECAEWAVRISAHNTKRLLDRFERGDVGAASAESKQFDEVRRQIALYFTQPFDRIEKYLDHPKLHAAHLIPKHFLQRRLIAVAAFKNDRRGASMALNNAIKALIDAGEIFEVNKAEVFKKHAVMSICFAVSDEASFKRFLRSTDMAA